MQQLFLFGYIMYYFFSFWLIVLWLGRLTYGLDYKGNVCGDKNAKPGLRQLELRYWLNPNQVYQSGLKGSEFRLANARSICLLDCPYASEDQLNWVCDYPEGDIHLSMDDWIDRNYDYYEFLTPEMRNSSLQLQGPCYPVIFPSVNGILTYSFKMRFCGPFPVQCVNILFNYFIIYNVCIYKDPTCICYVGCKIFINGTRFWKFMEITFAYYILLIYIFFIFYFYIINLLLLFTVYWSCQYIARASNISLRHWQQMGGVNINEDIIIDKSIHRSINSRSSVLKVDLSSQ